MLFIFLTPKIYKLKPKLSLLLYWQIMFCSRIGVFTFYNGHNIINGLTNCL